MSIRGVLILALIVVMLLIGAAIVSTNEDIVYNKGVHMKLPEPQKENGVSVEKALAERRSVREFSQESVSLQSVSQLLWATQGLTDSFKRTAPSAGGTYPLEVYVVAQNVEDLSPGVYQFIPESHELASIVEGDVSSLLESAALGQGFVGDAPLNIVISAVYERTAERYGERAERYVHMEAGHAAQNLYLQCESIGLGMVVVGAFNDEETREVLNTPEDPLYIIPIGKY